MQTLPATPSEPRRGAPAIISAALHLLLILLLVQGPSVATYFDDSRILPALYLYARDRRPTEPREMRLPLPAPRGNANGFAAPVALQPLDHGDRARSVRIPGMVPPGPVSARLDSVFSVLSVDSEVVRVEGSAAPVYPDALLLNGVEGFVEAEFVVDTSGLVDAGSVRILKSTHKDFSSAVRLALLGMEFRPAWRGSRRVRQLVTQRFTFHLQPPPAATTTL
jgi:TonB family protein